MANAIVEPFQQYNGTVEVVALRKLRSGTGMASEPQIEAVLADCEARDGVVQMHRTFVGCGQIDLLVERA